MASGCCGALVCSWLKALAEPSWHVCQWAVPKVFSDTELLSFVETSIQTSFSMTVKVNGVAQDGTTMYIHNKVHNRTRTLTCAGVSVWTAPQSPAVASVTDLLLQGRRQSPETLKFALK